MAIALDPDWARRRYEEAVRDRKVIGYRNDDGTANLSGHNLPTDKVAAACAHIDALAKKIKHAGDHRPIDHVRSDLYLAMLDGSYVGWNEHDIIAHALAAAAQANADDRDDDNDTERGVVRRFHGVSRHDRQSRHRQQRHSSTDDQEAQNSADGSDTKAGGEADTETGRETGGEIGKGSGGQVIEGPWPVPPPEPPDTPPTRGAGVEIRTEITTLLGLDDHPAEIPGWGHVHAELARTLVHDRTGAEWRYALTDDHGHLLYEGITRRRPDGYPVRAAAPTRGGIVELQIALSTLRRLAARPARLGPWANVIADLARQADRHEHGNQDTADTADTDEPGAIPNAGDRDRPHGPPDPEHDAQPDPERDKRRRAERDREQGRRSPGKTLRRRTQIRDRTCVHPGCRTPASGTDGDHTKDWAHGGATREQNIGSLCRHDHRLKHEGGWQVSQPMPGNFVWTSRLGRRYHVQRPLIIQPLPNPIPRVLPALSYYTPCDDTDGGDDAPTWWEPPAPQPDPEPPPRSDVTDETPPF